MAGETAPGKTATSHRQSGVIWLPQSVPTSRARPPRPAPSAVIWRRGGGGGRRGGCRTACRRISFYRRLFSAAVAVRLNSRHEAPRGDGYSRGAAWTGHRTGESSFTGIPLQRRLVESPGKHRAARRSRTCLWLEHIYCAFIPLFVNTIAASI